jgi:acyl carrier protein
MREAVAEAESRFGPVSGIVHAAGIMSGGGFQGLTGLDRDACDALFEPKLRGARVLESVFAGRRLDLCLLVSSLSTVLGGLGFAAYAAANCCLDALAATADSADGLPWRCVNWDGWRDDDEEPSQGSMVARLAMTPSEGVETFRRIAAMRGVARIVVSTADLDTRLEQWVTAARAEVGETAEEESQAAYERPELAQDYVGPRNETEEKIAAIWSQLLGIQQIGVHDDFLELGGHSLLATQLIARIRSQMEVEVSLEDVFRGPTVSALAVLIGERTNDSARGDEIESIKARLSQMSPEERQDLLAQARRSKQGAM